MNDPFVLTVETNYNDWEYNIPAFTICSDYVNSTFIDEYYQSSENITSIHQTYRNYSDYMRVIGSLNADNIHLIDKFENTELLKSLSGEELFNIALNVWTFWLVSFWIDITIFQKI